MRGSYLQQEAGDWRSSLGSNCKLTLTTDITFLPETLSTWISDTSSS